MTKQAQTQTWTPDRLGEGFSYLDHALGLDPEGETDIVVTLVRYCPEETDADEYATRRALLWVHGLNDYFFQDHVAKRFVDEGYAFYALELRKCGRSRRPGQSAHYSEDLSHYYPDFDAAVSTLSAIGHPDIVLMAHSTGGLIASLWADDVRRTHPAYHQKLAGLILNSPWLDMMYPNFVVSTVKRLALCLGKRFPRIALPNVGTSSYAESLHKDFHGEWSYDFDLRPVKGPTLYWGWLRAIFQGQQDVHEGKVNVGVPLLTLRSSTSYLNKPYSPATNAADAVLDTEQIAQWAPSLGDDVRIAVVDGARHDVFLSLEHAREEAFSRSLEFLRSL